ncbi:hypothetical protein QJQ45_026566 [Haematococcus lacustris]|nr:hypothetical protein QJQ45_026566 [Haematococcus lacustris]
MERNHSKQLRALVSIPSQDNHGSIPQSGKLLSFMPLDVGILEKQLLEEQQRIMEQEQEQLMLQVRPEVIKPITHLSVRLAQVMQARQQEVAAAAAAAQAAAVQAAATAAQQASSRHASGLLPLGVHGFPLPQHQLLQPNQGHTPGVTTSDPRSQHWPGNRSSASQVVVLLPPTAHWAADGLDGEGDLARVGGRVGPAAGALLSPHDLKTRPQFDAESTQGVVGLIGWVASAHGQWV